MKLEKDLLFEEETFAIRGACFEVYKDKGCGFLEAVYQECLELELGLRGIPFIVKPKLELEYKGQKLKCYYEPDLICYGKIIVELKALPELLGGNRAQTHNYLKARNLRVGLLVNFDHYPQVEIERIIR